MADWRGDTVGLKMGFSDRVFGLTDIWLSRFSVRVWTVAPILDRREVCDEDANGLTG